MLNALNYATVWEFVHVQLLELALAASAAPGPAKEERQIAQRWAVLTCRPSKPADLRT